MSDAPVTLITGSRKGLGRYLADYFVRRGHRVVGCSREPVDWALEGYHHIRADITEEKDIGALFAEIRRRFGRLDHLVNNAGIAAMNHFMLTPSATVRRVLETNYVGTFAAAREAARLMGKRKFGRIVNLTTVAVPLNLQGEAAYASAKAAVEAFTRIGAGELAELGITMNAVGPTPLQTDLIRGVPAAKIQALIGRQAIRRFGEPADVANVVEFFLKPESGFVTGQVIYLGGVS